jgi:aminopeptidase
VQFLSETLNHQVLQFGSLEQVAWVPEIEAYGMEWADVYIGLRGAHNLDEAWDIPAERLAVFRKSMGTISSLRWEKTRWCLVRVPNAALAQQAGMDEETLTDRFFAACFLDWPEVGKEWHRLAGILNQGKQVRVVGQGTDLRFSVEGRTWDAADGRLNMPDGEISTAPLESTLHGTISFGFPGVLGGRLVNDISLGWEAGRLVNASSSSNQDFLHSILATDAGASLIGEFAFGVNPRLDFFSRDILLDEKIGGTIHIALGRAYSHSGGTNQSAIHWDIVKDMRQEGEVFLDGKLIFQKGNFLI